MTKRLEDGDSLRLPFVQVQVLGFVANSESFEGEEDLTKSNKAKYQQICSLLIHAKAGYAPAIR